MRHENTSAYRLLVTVTRVSIIRMLVSSPCVLRLYSKLRGSVCSDDMADCLECLIFSIASNLVVLSQCVMLC